MPANLPVSLCVHIAPNKKPCRAVALAGYSLCFSHQRLHRRRQRRLHLEIPRFPAIQTGPLRDSSAILRAVSRVARALAANSINPDRADSLLQRIRLASDRLAIRRKLRRKAVLPDGPPARGAGVHPPKPSAALPLVENRIFLPANGRPRSIASS